ncbi:olfactory receptor 13A1-like [Sus scrofa]|uniref:olfactory receptor 13A1-like n=1 Tax=Sus scrofa TaxID=9823 RepID=UPI0003AEA023|nr:olfactory receptor 13A1-like [Sus scrofa]
MSNQSQVTEFILQGLLEAPHLQVLFFVLCLSLYTMALCGNSLIVVAISCSSGLHTPLYLFLVSLLVLDVICACPVVPKLLEILMAEKRGISYRGCMAQMYFLSWSVAGETLLLTAMAYKHYVAMCRPLHYGSTTGPWVCAVLTGAVWGTSMLGAGVNTCLMLRLTFCGPDVDEPSFFVADVLFAMLKLLLTVASHGCIVASILGIHMAEGKQRVFSTCWSHLLVVTVNYSTVIHTYVSPGSSYSPGVGKAMAVLYSSVSPTSNPLIYTLRKKDVKAALRNVFTLWAGKL